MAEFEYDVFLSHRSVNKPWVEILARNLNACGLRVFFDQWSLIPGHSLPQQLHDGIQGARKALLVATPEAADSGWVAEEHDALLSRRTQQPGFLIPLTFGGDLPDFAFLRNVLTVDFSDPSPAAYRDALHRLLCGIQDKPPGYNIELPAAIQIPEPISSDPKRAEAGRLSGGEQAAVGNMLAGTNNMQLLLAQKGVDRTLMQKAILKQGEQRFGAHNCLHASPLTSLDATTEKYFSAFGRSLKLNRPTPDADELRFALEDLIHERGRLLLLLTRFDDGADEPRKALANMLRTLCEEQGDKLRIIFCGGQKLAALRYGSAILSPLQNAEVTFWPESAPADLMQRHPQLDEPACNRLLALTGRQPVLLRAAIERHDPTDPDRLADDLLDYMCCNGFFSPYRDQGAQLRPLLQREQLAPHDYWPSDLLLRALFWDNLLTRKGGHFVWRCPLVRQCGLKMVGS